MSSTASATHSAADPSGSAAATTWSGARPCTSRSAHSCGSSASSASGSPSAQRRDEGVVDGERPLVEVPRGLLPPAGAAVGHDDQGRPAVVPGEVLTDRTALLDACVPGNDHDTADPDPREVGQVHTDPLAQRRAAATLLAVRGHDEHDPVGPVGGHGLADEVDGPGTQLGRGVDPTGVLRQQERRARHHDDGAGHASPRTVRAGGSSPAMTDTMSSTCRVSTTSWTR